MPAATHLSRAVRIASRVATLLAVRQTSISSRRLSPGCCAGRASIGTPLVLALTGSVIVSGAAVR